MNKTKKRVSEKEIKKVVREWIERMIDIFKKKETATKSISWDVAEERIDCPKCSRDRVVQFDPRRNEWWCLYSNCFFTFSRELTPPGPAELEEYWKRKKLEEKIQMFLKSK